MATKSKKADQKKVEVKEVKEKEQDYIWVYYKIPRADTSQDMMNSDTYEVEKVHEIKFINGFVWLCGPGKPIVTTDANNDSTWSNVVAVYSADSIIAIFDTRFKS